MKSEQRLFTRPTVARDTPTHWVCKGHVGVGGSLDERCGQENVICRCSVAFCHFVRCGGGGVGAGGGDGVHLSVK